MMSNNSNNFKYCTKHEETIISYELKICQICGM